VATLRIGLLGAARIAPTALLKPARALGNQAAHDRVQVIALAARDRDRAARFAARWGVPVVHADYQAVLDDPAVDAVYVPLPNGLHAPWTLRAIAAGKHVLCEKPFTANADQARAVARAAGGSGLVVMEAFHYRYHPLLRRVTSLLAEGVIGPVTRVETRFCFPLPRFGDIRYDYALAGGALMDAGCYAVHCARVLGPGEPTVVSAVAKLRTPDVDRAMTARLAYPTGATGTVTCSMWSRSLLSISAEVHGEAGWLRIFNFIAPQYWHRLTVRTATRRWSERVPGESTYLHQLRAFAAAVRGGPPVLTPPEDSVATMTVIDDIYRAAGLRLRGQA
jgi:predicted dehydrogenase